MPKCIYCTKSEPEVSFSRREHVIPEMFGTYEDNPTSENLTLRGLVCDKCNSDVFGPLESRFKEDTEEGIWYQQMYKLTGSCQVRIRNDKVKSTYSSGLGDKFFDEMFPFLDWMDGDWKVVLLPQIKIKQPGGGFHVLLIDRLKALPAGKRSKIKQQLAAVNSKDVRIFVGGDSADDALALDEAIQLVRNLGIPYKEGSRKFAPVEPSEGEKQFVVNMECTVGNDYGRVIAKIVFNYFAYCAQSCGLEQVLHDSSFDRLRSYVVGSLDLPIKEVIIDMGAQPVIWDEKEKGGRFVVHVVAFRVEDGNIIAEVSLLGRMVYKLLMGPVPDGLDPVNLGCGHLFSPFDHKLFQLTRNPNKWGSGMQNSFGLFCKN
jgi:hypothetical protein